MLLEADVDEAGRRSGYTPEYVRVAVEDGASQEPGHVVEVVLGEMREGKLQGRTVTV